MVGVTTALGRLKTTALEEQRRVKGTLKANQRQNLGNQTDQGSERQQKLAKPQALQLQATVEEELGFLHQGQRHPTAPSTLSPEYPLAVVPRQGADVATPTREDKVSCLQAIKVHLSPGPVKQS